MTGLEQRVYHISCNHPLAPLHAEQIYFLLLEDGDNATLEEVEKACDSLEGADFFACKTMKCYFAQD